MISEKKGEPEWLLEWRLKALQHFFKMDMPTWQNFDDPNVDFQSISYYAAPKSKPQLNSLDEVDPELLSTFEKLGIPLDEQKVLAGVVAVDAVFDSVSVKTTFQEKLREKGVIFCSFGEAVREHPELVRQYLGTVVPQTDNVYAALHIGLLAVAAVIGFVLGKWLNGLGLAYATLFVLVLSVIMVGAQLTTYELACRGHNDLIRHWQCEPGDQ